MNTVSLKLALQLVLVFTFASSTFAATTTQSHSSVYYANGIIINGLDSHTVDELRSDGISESLLTRIKSFGTLCISIRNRTPKAISDVNVQYRKVPSEAGAESVFETFSIPLTATRLPGRGLQPGGKLIVCPLPEINEAIFRRINMAPSAEQRLLAAQTEFSSSRYSEVVVSVDSVIMDDGLVYGPDRIDVVRKAEEMYRGKMTVMREFVNRGGEDLPAIRKWLTELKDDFGMYDHQIGRPDFFKQAAAMAARDILFLFDKMPKSNVLPAIKMQLANPPSMYQPHR